MTLLLCNIGGADLICADLPKERRGERLWADEVWARYAELSPLLRLPIISKAMVHLQNQDLVPEHVVLIASDQPASASRFWESDTCTTAQIISRLLAEGVAGFAPIPAERISTWVIRDADGVGADPSDYDLVLAFLERQLPHLHATFPTGSAFLEVTGGTPAMTTGLLIAGTEVFGARAELLSIHPRRPLPASVGTGRRLLAAPLRASLRSHAATCAYDAALTLFREHRDTIGDQLAPGALDLIDHLLDYARCRYNFDFPGARTALESAKVANTPWEDAAQDLLQQVHAPDRKALLAEVVHGATVRYSAGLYADFLTQLVRFEENLLRNLCLDRGVQFVSRNGGNDPDGSLISRTWLRSQPFSLPRDYDDGRDRSNSRALMREMIPLLAKSRSEDLRNLLTQIDRLRPLVYLRNDLTHSLDGVRQADLAQRFTNKAEATQADSIISHLCTLYTMVTGEGLPSSPFTAINQLLDRLLQAKGGTSGA